ncbi:hypothetical protein GYMLUDRAFT_53493 [Collybiopsis luxurians FD-317 M1]|nr:hypothetical protein GYMLUDRAFT_53493 [Collybiopsis luxurians FD-317 M1]
MAERATSSGSHVRVLHSVSPSQSYVLSRSPTPITIYPVPPKSQPQNTQNSSSSLPPPRFARVSLKACIDIICENSSELFNDNTRDYSVYTLDPLETFALTSTPGANSRQVSLACGRISSIRALNDPTTVVGTMTEDRFGQEFLEVVFVLTVTCAPLKVPDPAAADRINAALARRMGEQGRGKRKRERDPLQRAKSKNTYEADRLLTQYGGGKLKAAEREYEHGVTSAALSNPSPEINAILTLLKDDPNVNQAALLRVLSHIDSVTKEQPGLSVAEALRYLAPKASAPQSSTTASMGPGPQTPPQTPAASNEPQSPDDAIVVLDKENVNPSAFRRRVERVESSKVGLEDPSKADATAAATSNPLLSTSQPPVITANTARKRTISEALGEDSQASSSSSSSHPLGQYIGLYRFPGQPLSSPPRPSHTNAYMNLISPSGLSKDRPIVIPDSPSPAKPKPSRQTQELERPGSPNLARRGGPSARLHPYILPSLPTWARTSTATQPRLSEEAQQAILGREEKRLEEKRGKRLKWLQQRKTDAGDRGMMQRTNSTPALFSTGLHGREEPSQGLSRLKPTVTPGSMAPPPPVSSAASVLVPLLPVIAAPEQGSDSPSPSPPPTQSLAPPCTPPRRRAFSTTAVSLSSPSLEHGEEGFSVFTPDANARDLGVSLFTPSTPLTPRRGPSLFGTPRSPSMRSLSQRYGPDEREATPPPSSEPVTEDGNDEEEDEEASDDIFAKELNSALEEAEVGGLQRKELGEEEGEDGRDQGDENDNEESELTSTSLLPPSSPPAPSSPLLQPYQDHDDDSDLPMPSSDFDVDVDVTSDENSPQSLSGLDGPENIFHEGTHAEDLGDFDEAAIAAILEMISNNANGNDSLPSSSVIDSAVSAETPSSASSSFAVKGDPGDIFRDLGAISNEDGGHQTFNPIQDPSLSLSSLSAEYSLPEDIDFDTPSFWDAFGPLLGQSQTADTDNQGATVDPVKNLLSGCVL